MVIALRDAAAAEDAVQDALLAALAAEASFAGRSNSCCTGPTWRCACAWK